MRGRGSRLCPRIGKTEFIIYDFVGNTKKFNDPGQLYHKPKVVGKRPAPDSKLLEEKNGTITRQTEPIKYQYPKPEFLLIRDGSLEDEIRKREILIVGPEGLAIDRRSYRDEWRARILELRQSDPAVDKIFRGEELTPEEWESLARRLNSPEFYFTEQSLRYSFEQPGGSLSDFIRAALGVYQFPTRGQRIERAFNTWVAEHSNSIYPDQARMLRLLQARVLTGEQINIRLFSQPPFSLWGGLVRMEQLFGKRQLMQMVDELNILLAA
jgi:type I restriction enzyme R subunit